MAKPKAASIKVKKKKLLEALERSLGIVTSACKEVGLSRNQFYLYYNTDEDFKKRVDEIQDITLDFVENQLLKKIRDGSEKSILFYMKYRGRKRGYIDKIDVNNNISGSLDNITIEIIKNKDKDEN